MTNRPTEDAALALIDPEYVRPEPQTDRPNYTRLSLARAARMIEEGETPETIQPKADRTTVWRRHMREAKAKAQGQLTLALIGTPHSAVDLTPRRTVKLALRSALGRQLVGADYLLVRGTMRAVLPPEPRGIAVTTYNPARAQETYLWTLAQWDLHEQGNARQETLAPWAGIYAPLACRPAVYQSENR